MMNSKPTGALAAILLVLLSLGPGLTAGVRAEDSPPAAAKLAAKVWDVRQMGAKADGLTSDTAVFQKALDACQTSGGGTVLVPRGNYLIGSITLGSNSTLQLESRANLIGSREIADYPLVRVRWEGEFEQGRRALISAEDASHIAIVGPGCIYGPPVNLSGLRHPRGPSLIELANCTDVTLDGFSTQYQQLWSLHPVLCRKLVARNLTRAPPVTEQEMTKAHEISRRRKTY
jgi:polygalacturonase